MPLGRYWEASGIHSTRYSGLFNTSIRSSTVRMALSGHSLLYSGNSMSALVISQNMTLSSMLMSLRLTVVVNSSSGSHHTEELFSLAVVCCTQKGSEMSPTNGLLLSERAAVGEKAPVPAPPIEKAAGAADGLCSILLGGCLGSIGGFDG